MSLSTKKDARARATASALDAGRRARDTAAQLTPMAKNASTSARQGMQQARTWAAPRLDQAGKTVQDQLAPRLAEILRDAARRVEPEQDGRRRWPLIAAAAGALAAGASALAYVLTRRDSTPASEDNPGTPASEPGGEAAPAGADGQVRTS